MQFFQRSGLSMDALAKIWDAVDQTQQGFLLRRDFGVALRAVACAQSGGRVPSASHVRSLDVCMPPPRMHGLALAVDREDGPSSRDDLSGAPPGSLHTTGMRNTSNPTRGSERPGVCIALLKDRGDVSSFQWT